MAIRFYRPRSKADTLAIMAALGDRAWPVAGGTDLLLQLRAGARDQRHLVSLAQADLHHIAVRDDEVEIGACATLAQLIGHAELRARLPGFVSACGQIGSCQIQAVATVGGNLGNASPAADTATPLLVAESRVRLASATGEREVPIDELFLGPGRTCRRPDELIAAIVVPTPPAARGRQIVDHFRKYGPRRANVISATNFAARFELDGHRVAVARVAFGSVAPTPIRATATETWLAGRDLGERAHEDAGLAAAVDRDIAPLSDVRGSRAYKTALAENSVRQALWKTWQELQRREAGRG